MLPYICSLSARGTARCDICVLIILYDTTICVSLYNCMSVLILPVCFFGVLAGMLVTMSAWALDSDSCELADYFARYLSGKPNPA